LKRGTRGSVISSYLLFTDITTVYYFGYGASYDGGTFS